MNLVDRVGSDTITRLELAAAQRLSEATSLLPLGHRLASIYLCGYAAEMTIGSAYFKLQGTLRDELIEDDRLKYALTLARRLSTVADKSHPLDGLARLLVNEKKSLAKPGYRASFGQAITDRVDSICQHWTPKLRYRDIDPTDSQADEVIVATRWLVSNYPDM